MKRLLALAAFAALASAPLAAHAQRAQPAAAAPKVDIKAQRDKGMKEAPPIVAQSGVACQVTDAVFKGQGDDKGADGKSVGKFSAYEVACREGPGYIVINKPSAPGKPQMVNCIIASGGATKCDLPQNTDFKAALQPYLAQAKRTCDISGERYVGSSASNGMTFYEVACGAQPGFLLGVSETNAKPPEATDCIALLDTPQACQLTTKAVIASGYASAVAKSGKSCQVSDVRSIGASKGTGDTYTEIACGSSPGFVLVTDTAGAYKNTIDCGKAQGIGGGCKMTDTTVAESADAASYTKLAQKAGYPCSVSKYRFIGTDAQNREVVEVACSDHPDGALAVFSETGKSEIYDCVRAGAMGGATCKLSDPALVYPKYTAAIASKGRTGCKVSGAGFLARTTSGIDYVETACADGTPGWVVGFRSGGTDVAELLTCKQASNSGIPCKLATNQAGNK